MFFLAFVPPVRKQVTFRGGTKRRVLSVIEIVEHHPSAALRDAAQRHDDPGRPAVVASGKPGLPERSSRLVDEEEDEPVVRQVILVDILGVVVDVLVGIVVHQLQSGSELAGTRCAHGFLRPPPRGVVVKFAGGQSGFEFRSHRIPPAMDGRHLLVHGGDVVAGHRSEESAPRRGGGAPVLPQLLPELTFVRHVVVGLELVLHDRPLRQLGEVPTNVFLCLFLGGMHVVF